jgi:hypothetical protein
MNDNKFKEAVKRMIYCQEEFVRTKNYYALQNLTTVSREVKKMLDDEEEAEKLQLKLYPEGEE